MSIKEEIAKAASQDEELIEGVPAGKYKKGLRLVSCPACHKTYTGKYLIAIARCTCGYSVDPETVMIRGEKWKMTRNFKTKETILKHMVSGAEVTFPAISKEKLQK